MAGLILPMVADNSQISAYISGGLTALSDDGLGAVLKVEHAVAGRRADRQLCFFMLFKKTRRPDL
jgi:hypothetical protein